MLQLLEQLVVTLGLTQGINYLAGTDSILNTANSAKLNPAREISSCHKRFINSKHCFFSCKAQLKVNLIRKPNKFTKKLGD